jgi:competence protein ComEA
VPEAPPSPIDPLRPLPEPSWRDRLDTIVERARVVGPGRVAAAMGVALVVALVGFVLLRPAAADRPPELDLPRASSASAAPDVTAAAATLVVQAAGAVTRPGVYRLSTGARVDDLVAAAGGLATDADPDRVNLAARLTDGEKVYVPRVGESLPADSAAEGAGSSTAPSAPVDLNTASVTELDALPGVGPATAQAIVDYRTQHGPFRSVDDLLDVRGIGPAKLDAIRPLVSV